MNLACMASSLAYCNERNPFAAIITIRAHSLGVKGRLTVHEKIVLVMTMTESERQHPPAVWHAAHRSRSRVPMVKITRHEHAVGGRRFAEKRHISDRFLVSGRVSNGVGFKETIEATLRERK